MEPTDFAHSFLVLFTDPGPLIADCVYGGHRAAAMVGRGNIRGCQFHPEKSGEVGLKILNQFLAIKVYEEADL